MKYVYIHSSVETTMGGFRYRSAIVYTHRICNYVSIPAKFFVCFGGPRIKHPQKYNGFGALIGSPRAG